MKKINTKWSEEIKNKTQVIIKMIYFVGYILVYLNS